jgi:hypothetical protein
VNLLIFLRNTVILFLYRKNNEWFYNKPKCILIMMNESTQVSEQKFNHMTVKSMINALNESINNDLSLANDLFHFLRDRGIAIPALARNNGQKKLPVSFNTRCSNQQQEQLKKSFYGVDSIEHIL